MAWDTVANIFTDAAIELGLAKAAIADPYAETNQNLVQLRHLLKSLGQHLQRSYRWSHLTEEHTFNTSDGTASYSLPADFWNYVPGTGWNRTASLPLAGPVDEVEWQALKGASSTGPVSKVFRIWKDKLHLYPTPGTTVEAIYFEYRRKYWVAATGGVAPTKEAPTVNSDELWFDRQLLLAGLKYQWRRSKKMATQDDLDEYLEALSLARGADGAKPILSLTGGGFGTARMLDEENIPTTGFGS